MKKKSVVKARTFNAILDISVENPLLQPQQIAILLQRDITFVKHVMQSDAFLEMRARRIMERYGDKINGVKGKIFDTAADVLDAMRTRFADPASDVKPEVQLQFLEFLMKYVTPSLEIDAKRPHEPNQQVNLTLNFEDLNRARALQAERARAIEVTAPQPKALPSKPSDA